jgi:dTDP-4-amino-4,6-dideoxygalactose transaminase
MHSTKIWLSPPHMGGQEQKYIQEVIASNWVSSVGPAITLFEESLENYLGTGSVVALNSGTSAIHLALIMLGVKAGDEVLCQSMTFSASANPILYQGAIPIFVDSELDTWNICPVALEQAIQDRIAKGKKPKAIIAVHLYGVPYQVTAVRALADQYGIPIIEDAAEALGSSYKGKLCGTFGDIGIFSFNGSKVITTSSGGAMVVPNSDWKEKAIFFATQSKDKAVHYEHSELGYNYRMSTICAAIGQGQMEVLASHLAKRNAMHTFYEEVFENYPGITVYTVPNSDYCANYWLTTILINPVLANGITPEIIRLGLQAQAIESRPLWKPMHLQPLFKNAPYYGNAISEALFEKGLCLPSGSNLTQEERDKIKAVLWDILN